MNNTAQHQPIAITPGEPAGCGPDIILSLLEHNLIDMPIIIFADQTVLEHRAQELGYHTALSNLYYRIQHITCPYPITAGEPSKENANYVLNTISQAAKSCMNGECHALVTGPVNKSIINQAGIPFSGHTEYLATLANVTKTVMMLMTKTLKVALLTTHIPLKKVCEAITQNSLIETVTIIHHNLKHYFNISQPKISICGLNPHCGEQGQMGDEEQLIIMPAIALLRQKGIACAGPISADTAFTAEQLQKSDIVLALYHDQGLPVIKALDFYGAINMTLGLPFIRTSVDHGTAFDLAGSGRANHTSMLNALQLAHQLTPLTSRNYA